MFELSINGHFSSAHFLREYEGKCRQLHGHTWKVEISVEGMQLNELGMLSDFGELKKKLNHVLSSMDHVCLNEVEFFKENNPTAENITKYIYNRYSEAVTPLKVKKVRVWESDTTSVTYYE